MASTNKTPNFNLPQFLGTDKASWLGDINPAMFTIDSQMQLNKTNANQAISSASNAVTVANGASSTANSALDKANGASSTANSALAKVNGESLTVLHSFTKDASNVSGTPVVSVSSNPNKTLLNLYGGMLLEAKNHTEYPKLGNITGINPSQTRTLYNIGTLYIQYTTDNKRTIPVSAELRTNGDLYLIFHGNLTNTFAPSAFDFNAMLNTVSWF